MGDSTRLISIYNTNYPVILHDKQITIPNLISSLLLDLCTCQLSWSKRQDDEVFVCDVLSKKKGSGTILKEVCINNSFSKSIYFLY